MPVYYPIFLDLAQRRCLVVGGGIVAEQKVCGLLEAEAAVVVVSPLLTTPLRRWASQGAITHISRAFRDEDVEGCALIIGATDREEVNRHVALAASRRRIWVNIVDRPAACDFIAPAVVRRGAVQIAISTGGKSPTLAKRLREGLEALIGPEYGDVADILGALRAAVRGGGEALEGRKVMFERLVEASGLPLLMAATTQDPGRRATPCQGAGAEGLDCLGQTAHAEARVSAWHLTNYLGGMEPGEARIDREHH